MITESLVVGNYRLMEDLAGDLAVLKSTHDRIQTLVESKHVSVTPYEAFGYIALGDDSGNFLACFPLTEDSVVGKHNSRFTYVSGLWRPTGDVVPAILLIDTARHRKIDKKLHTISANVYDFEVIPPKEEPTPEPAETAHKTEIRV